VHLPSFTVLRPPSPKGAHVHPPLHPYSLLHCAPTSCFDMHFWDIHVHSSAVLQPPAPKCTHLHCLMHPPALISCSPTSCPKMYTSKVSDASMCNSLLSDLLLPLSPKCTPLHSLVDMPALISCCSDIYTSTHSVESVPSMCTIALCTDLLHSPSPISSVWWTLVHSTLLQSPVFSCSEISTTTFSGASCSHFHYAPSFCTLILRHVLV
jgi:hypothetical protein